MTPSKSEVTSKPQENANTDNMKDQQTVIDESASNVKSAPKPKFQTKICDHWRRSGSCSYGVACWYAHGEDDLRKINISRNNRNVDEYGRDKEEAPKKDEPRTSPPPKRASTNVKGLTVNIPSNIAFKETAPNDSMPLSPAQERWISMSVGGTVVPPTTGEKAATDTATIPVKNGTDNELDKKCSMENVLDRRPTTGKFLRDDDIDDYGFLSPNPFPHPQGSSFGTQGSSFGTQNPSHHQRSFSRGPHQRGFTGHPFGGVPSQQPMMPGQEQARISRSGSMNMNYIDRQFLPAQKSTSNLRTSRENIPAAPPAPQIQQAIWNVAGEIYQRQKDIETVGRGGPGDQYNMHQPKESTEIGRLLAKLKSKDLSCLRFMVEQGMLGEKDMPRQTWNELINSVSSQQGPPPMPPQAVPTQFYSNNTGLSNSDQSGSDCSCKSSRPRGPFEPNPPSHFHHQPHPHHHFSQHQHQYYPPQHHHQQHHQQQFFRHQAHFGGGSMSAHPELAAPPKIFESLLPSDETFSIWLDPKPKKTSGGFIRPSSHGVEHSNSGTSLLTKMEALRSDKCPISEEEMISSTGARRAVLNNKPTSSVSSSPPVLSLMELLSSENLLEEPATKTTMFDFDTLKIAETLRSTQQSAQSSQASSVKSPKFFFVDEKTPNIDEYCTKPSGLYTPMSSNQTPSFMEQCDFFATGGSCPFGDGCQLSHNAPPLKRDQQQLEAAL